MDPSFEALAARAGQTCTFETSLGPVELTLAAAQPRGAGGSLLFHGPNARPLDQGTYPVRVGDVEGLLFIVPVGQADQRSYEAVFS